MSKYIVKLIVGDYATLVGEDGEENTVAMALLPEYFEEGDTLIKNGYQYATED